MEVSAGRRRLPFLAAILSLLPLLIWLPKFRLLYWFHDDWDLLDDWTTFGTAAWIRQPMAENFGAISKLAWIGAIHLTGGSYFGMIALMWMTHLAILLLFAALLLRCEFSEPAAAIAVLMVGLSWTNIEMLGWATQWSSMLCTMCLLIAWVAVAGNIGRWGGILAVAAILLGGTMLARGIPYGALLGVFLWLSGRDWRFAALLGACSLLLFLSLTDT